MAKRHQSTPRAAMSRESSNHNIDFKQQVEVFYEQLRQLYGALPYKF
jgi:hypothetical protein